uniref:Putative conserved secreted protein n=1 Tax=Culex tarsalis TaxID=7177 RepID=A0A1Q3FRC0_CULTA
MSAKTVTLVLLISVMIVENFARAKPVDDVVQTDKNTSEDGVQQSNIIDGPVVCPPGQKPDHNGKCREVWGRKTT